MRTVLRVIVSTLLLVVLLVLPGRAQSLPIDHWTPALSSASGQQTARTVSWVGVGAGIGLKTWDALKAPDRKKALIAEAGGFSLTAASTVILKKLVHRERPCAPGDCGTEEPRASFPSGHVGTACFSIPRASGRGLAFIGAAIAVIVAEGRILGNRHWLTDTLAGCANGLTWGYLMARLTK